MCLLFALFQWRDHVKASKTDAEIKITVLEQKEQELQAFIQQLSIDLQKVSREWTLVPQIHEWGKNKFCQKFLPQDGCQNFCVSLP